MNSFDKQLDEVLNPIFKHMIWEKNDSIYEGFAKLYDNIPILFGYWFVDDYESCQDEDLINKLVKGDVSKNVSEHTAFQYIHAKYGENGVKKAKKAIATLDEFNQKGLSGTDIADLLASATTMTISSLNDLYKKMTPAGAPPTGSDTYIDSFQQAEQEEEQINQIKNFMDKINKIEAWRRIDKK